MGKMGEVKNSDFHDYCYFFVSEGGDCSTL